MLESMISFVLSTSFLSMFVLDIEVSTSTLLVEEAVFIVLDLFLNIPQLLNTVVIANIQKMFFQFIKFLFKFYYFFALLSFRQICIRIRSEEHTSELQSRFDIVCRLL